VVQRSIGERRGGFWPPVIVAFAFVSEAKAPRMHLVPGYESDASTGWKPSLRDDSGVESDADDLHGSSTASQTDRRSSVTVGRMALGCLRDYYASMTKVLIVVLIFWSIVMGLKSHNHHRDVADVAFLPYDENGAVDDAVLNMNKRLSPDVWHHAALVLATFTMLLPLTIALRNRASGHCDGRWYWSYLVACATTVAVGAAACASAMQLGELKSDEGLYLFPPSIMRTVYVTVMWGLLALVLLLGVATGCSHLLGKMMGLDRLEAWLGDSVLPALLAFLVPQIHFMIGVMLATGMSYSDVYFGQAVAHLFACWIWALAGTNYVFSHYTISRSHYTMPRFEHRMLMFIGITYGLEEKLGAHPGNNLEALLHPHVTQAINFFSCGALGLLLEQSNPKAAFSGMPMATMLWVQCTMYFMHMQPWPVSKLVHQMHALWLGVGAATRLAGMPHCTGVALVLAAFQIYSGQHGISSIMHQRDVMPLHYSLFVGQIALLSLGWAAFIVHLGNFTDVNKFFFGVLSTRKGSLRDYVSPAEVSLSLNGEGAGDHTGEEKLPLAAE